MPGITVANVEDRDIDSARQNLQVCVLDDDTCVLEVIVETLAQLGFPASGTTDPNQALKAVRARSFSVVLTDVKMPQMGGFTFLEHALVLDPGVEIILMTGDYSLDSAIEAIKRGAYDYVTKPVDRARLAKTLDEIAEHSGRKRQIVSWKTPCWRSLKSTASSAKAPPCWRCLSWRGKWPSTTPTC